LQAKFDCAHRVQQENNSSTQTIFLRVAVLLSLDQMERHMTQIDVLEFLIGKGPGRTEATLAKAIFGEKGEQTAVNQDCRRLADAGRVERRGAGGIHDPFRYYPK
jgi:hypothetical protein